MQKLKHKVASHTKSIWNDGLIMFRKWYLKNNNIIINLNCLSMQEFGLVAGWRDEIMKEAVKSRNLYIIYDNIYMND